GPFVNVLNRGTPVDPDLAPVPSLPAYREFVAGLKEHFIDVDASDEHYRQAARLDSTFIAPLIQIAFHATWHERCATTDSIGVALDHRQERMTTWDRLTIDALRAYCAGDIPGAVDLLERRLSAYPRSNSGKAHLSLALMGANRPSDARELMLRMDPT